MGILTKQRRAEFFEIWQKYRGNLPSRHGRRQNHFSWLRKNRWPKSNVKSRSQKTRPHSGISFPMALIWSSPRSLFFKTGTINGISSRFRINHRTIFCEKKYFRVLFTFMFQRNSSRLYICRIHSNIEAMTSLFMFLSTFVNRLARE